MPKRRRSGGSARDVLAVDEDPARVGRLEAGDQAQHGRLAAAGGAEQGDDLALAGAERDAARDGERAEALLERLEAEKVGHPAAGSYLETETRARDTRTSRPSSAKETGRNRRQKARGSPPSRTKTWAPMRLASDEIGVPQPPALTP